MSPQVYQEGLAIPGKKKIFFPLFSHFFLTALPMLLFQVTYLVSFLKSQHISSHMEVYCLQQDTIWPSRVAGIVMMLIHFIFL